MANTQKQLLNGIVQTKAELFDVLPEKLPGVLYFVRTDAKGKEGYTYLNGRKYGNIEELRKEMQDIIGTLPTGQTISEIIEELQNAISNLDEKVEGLENHVASAETKIDANEEAISGLTVRVEYAERDIETLNADSGTPGSVEQKIAEAIAKLPEDMFVTSGYVETVSGVTYIVLVLKNGKEIRIPASKLIDVYKSGDDMVVISGYTISLNAENIAKNIGLEDYAKEEDLEAVEEKLNETISGLTATQEELEGFEASAATEHKALEDKDTSLQNQIDALNSILRITGDNVQTISDEQLNVNMIKNVTENGGTAVLTNDAVIDKTITIE